MDWRVEWLEADQPQIQETTTRAKADGLAIERFVSDPTLLHVWVVELHVDGRSTKYLLRRDAPAIAERLQAATTVVVGVG